MNSTPRHIMITLSVQNGEYRHTERTIKEIRPRQKATTQANRVASQWYGKGKQDDSFANDAYFFHGGCIAVSISNVQEIPQNELDTVKKYIIEI